MICAEARGDDTYGYVVFLVFSEVFEEVHFTEQFLRRTPIVKNLKNHIL